MKSSKLVTYLTQIGKYQLRVEIAKQILAQNMNFSPAWLIAILNQKNNLQNQNIQECQVLTKNHFRLFFKLIGFICDNQQFARVFQYFDRQNKGVIKNSDFIEFLLPSIREGLRNAVIKRTVQDIQLTFDLKHGLRRLFTQIMNARVSLKLYQGDFGSHEPKSVQPENLTKQNISKFLNRYCKYPTQTELILIYNCISQQKTKEISINQILCIIEESQKQIQYLSKNPIVLNQKIENQLINLKVKEVQGAIQLQKIVRKGQIQRQRIINKHITRKQNLFSTWEKEKDKSPPRSISKNRTRKLGHKQMIQSPIKSYKNSPLNSSQKKEQASSPFSHPNFKIQRTTSIIQPEEKANFNSNNLNEVNGIHYKSRQIQQIATPFKKLQFAPTIFQPSRKKSAQSDLSQLINTNLKMEGQILQHKLQNQKRIRQLKQHIN